MKLTNLILLTIFLPFLLPQPTQAVAKQGLTISPLIIEETVAPGGKAEGKIKIYSQSDEDVYVKFSAQDFKARGEEGEQSFATPEEENYAWSLSQWISLPAESVFLKPGNENKREVEYSISVPSEAEPGGYYAAIFAVPDVEKISHGTTTIGKMGCLVLLTVEGEIIKQGKLLEFETFQEIKKPGQAENEIRKISFFKYPPINFLVRFENIGNIHLKPQGKIEVFNIFKKKIEEIKVNEKGRNALPDSIRRFKEEWTGGWPLTWKDKKLTLGKFEAKLTLDYDNDQEFLYDYLSFWVVPIKELALILGGLILLIILLIWGIKGYNRWILARAGEKDEVEKLKEELARLKEGSRKQESGIREKEAGSRNQEEGIRNQELGIRNQELGIREKEEQKNEKTEEQKNKETEEQKNKETEEQRDIETEEQRNIETEELKNKEIEKKGGKKIRKPGNRKTGGQRKPRRKKRKSLIFKIFEFFRRLLGIKNSPLAKGTRGL